MTGLWLLAACAGTPDAAIEAAPAVAEAAPVGAKLVVLVVVDQFPVRALEAVKPWLTGGLKRLLDDGWRATGAYPYAVTYTCVGHATLVTGASPAAHGVVSNGFMMAGEKTYCIDAPVLAESVGQVFKAGGGLVAAVSLKDRAAVLMGSPEGDVVAWYDRELVGWKPWRGAVPTGDWAITGFKAQTWEASHDYSAVAPDDQPFEGDVDGLGRTFPRPVLGSLPDDAFLLTPHAGTWMLEGAMGAVETLGLGQDAIPDLLGLSFSNVDEAGHAFTTESWEYLDNLVVMDRDLGRLMDLLDTVVGEGDWSMVLTGDHGSAPDPVRMPRDDVRAGLSAHLEAEGYPSGTYLSDPHVWLPVAVAGEEREAMARSAATWLTQVEGIAAAYPWRVEGGLPDDAPYAEMIRLSVHPDRAGDVYVIPDEGTIFASSSMDGFGTRHGTPYEYDTHVPLMAYGAGVPTGDESDPQDLRRVAPTLTRLAGLPTPSGAEAPALMWALGAVER